jgi:hypothetical protein
LAEAQYVRALWLPGDDPRPCVIAGLGTLHRFFAENPGPVVVRDSAPALVLKIRERFACALERDPGNPEALAGYGKTFTYQLVPTPEAIDALERAAAALPTRTDVLVDLVVLYANAGQRAAADRLLHGVLEPRLSLVRVRRLEARIVEADRRIGVVRGNALIQEGVALFNSGRYGEARKKLVSGLGFPLSAKTEADVRRLIRRVDDLSKPRR